MQRKITIFLFFPFFVNLCLLQAETKFIAFTKGDSIVFYDEKEITNVFSNNVVDSFAVQGELTPNAVDRIRQGGEASVQVMDWSEATFVAGEYYLNTYPTGWKKLERFYFPEENPNEYKLSLNYAFYSSAKLKHIYNFDKLTYITDLSQAFYSCASLDSIILTKNVNADIISKRSSSIGSTGNAITLVDSALFVSNQKIFQNCSNLLTTFDSITSADYLLDDKIFWAHADLPMNIIVNDTIWKVGESFETAATLTCAEMRKQKLQESDHVWIGLRNECIKSYRWKEATSHTGTMVTIYKKEDYKAGETIIQPLDTFSEALYYKANSIKIAGAIRQRDMDILEKIVQINNSSLKYLDMSLAYFAEPLQIKLAHSKLQKITLPTETCPYEINLGKAFQSSYELRTIENLDKLHFITNLDNSFSYCDQLESITFPDVPLQVDSLEVTFYRCGKLTRIDNFDRLGNISYMHATFRGCSLLETISFSDQIDNFVYMDEMVFQDCKNLSQIINLDKVKLSFLGDDIFSGCQKLSAIHLNITKDTKYPYPACYDCYTEAFEECDAVIYLVNGYKETQRWIWTANIVYPIDSFHVHLDRESGEMAISELSPKYCAIQDTAWKFVKGEKETIVKKFPSIDKETYDVLYCGIKNDSMPDYVWSTNPIYCDTSNYDKYVSYSIKSIKSFVPIEKLQPSQLYMADTIITHGELNNEDIIRLKESLRLINGDKIVSGCTNLEVADFSNSRMEVTNGLEGFFQESTHLEEVKFPKEKITSPVDFTNTFAKSGCQEVDLGSFVNIVCMDRAFCESNVKTVLFPKEENNNEVSFIQTFAACPLDSINLSAFTRISDLSQTFNPCSSRWQPLRSITFSEKENPLSVSMFQTFTGTTFDTDEIVNFDKFTNANNYLATFQMINNFKGRLDTIRIGTDPFKIASDSLTWTFLSSGRIIKYLPDGVDSVPSKWRNCHDFVVPITVDSSNWSIDSLFQDYQLFSDFIYTLPDLGPSYAYIADTTWYLVLNDYLQAWINSFGFNSSLRAASAEQPLSSNKYMAFDPQTMDIADYMEDYSLACVASNPKHKALAYQVKLKDLREKVQIPQVITDTDCKIYTDQGTIVISASTDSDVEVYDTTGKLIHIGHVEKDKELRVNVSNGIYLVKCGKHSRGKVTVKNSKK